jgi:hypothetical protein
MIGYYGNHNKRKGDIVQIARWEIELLEKFDKFYEVSPRKIDEVKFIVVIVDLNNRTIGIIPKNERIKQVVGRVPLDGASLIRVGRLA